MTAPFPRFEKDAAGEQRPYLLHLGCDEIIDLCQSII